MKRLLLVLIPVLFVLGFLWTRRSAPPQVPFARVTRETVTSTLNTNGKVEPVQWSAIRAERDGAVEKIFVQEGQTVKAGQLLVQLDATAARLDLSSAQARIAEAQAQADVLARGGQAGELAEIESGLARARADLANAQRELETLQRLEKKNAATRSDVQASRKLVQAAELEIRALERRRASLVTSTDKEIAEARISEAQGVAAEARRRIALSQIRSPIPGILYQFNVNPGSYLAAGDLAGHAGKLDQLRVIIYVDEPELGRVQKGMPVTITWDAMPGREWKGTIERLPTQVSTLGTRQVGEVYALIENEDLSLIPGTNINAEIRSSVVENALSIPREALRREGNEPGVFLLGEDNQLVWQPVKLGVSSVTRIQVADGLSEGDAVALPADRSLESGMEVEPVFP